ncbi:unnamed protein product [Arabis nemorensis]|uniref:Uncharacterized protein n=1 Tax=Arabis nemorensis TaxID=586526 RepID=A0A565CKA0_9BRAS|nr:unnamed protein product [Arabis nemorensis]
MSDQRSKTNRWNWEVSGFEPRKSSSNASFEETSHRTTGPLVRRNSISTASLPPHSSLLPKKQALASKVNGLKEKVKVVAISSGVALTVHVCVSWLFVYGLKLGVIGTMATINVSWWLNVFILFTYITCGGCPITWPGFSIEAFTGLWEYVKLSVSSGIMICLDNWYYKILIVMTGNLKDAKIAIDSLSICMSIDALEMMIPFAFFAATGVRVANELGAGNGKGARFAMIVSGVWAGMILGGTAIQTLILIFITMRCDWAKEAQKASVRVKKWSGSEARN